MTATRGTKLKSSVQSCVVKVSKKKLKNGPSIVFSSGRSSRRVASIVAIAQLAPKSISGVQRVRQPTAAASREAESQNLNKSRLEKIGKLIQKISKPQERNIAKSGSKTERNGKVAFLVAEKGHKQKSASVNVSRSFTTKSVVGSHKKLAMMITASKKAGVLPLTVSAIKKLNKLNSNDAGDKKVRNSNRKADAMPEKKVKKIPLTLAQLKKLAKQKILQPVIPKRVRVKKPKEFEFKGSDWSGNSDDEGSVDFALLDEDLCYECGLDTSDMASWDNLIICDACDGEYHVACIRLDRIPRNGYICHRCKQEEQEFSKLKFTVGDHFEIPRLKKGCTLGRCYSPSRPLKVAFEECKRKGFMLVSQLFSFELMRELTHGSIQKLTNSGRIADIWEGATHEISKRLGGSSHNLVDRQGRFDMRIPEYVVDNLKLALVLEPLLSHLRTIMPLGKKKPELRTHNIVFVPVGSKEQIWHVDDCVRRAGLPERYFTILIQLNRIDENCGGTEVWSKEVCRGDLIRGRPGDAFVFPGSLLHRGRGNEGNSHRFFYYASFSSETDNNN